MLRLARKRLGWHPTLAGWLVTAALCLTAIWVYTRNIHGFLAMNRPENSRFLIVPGNVSDSALGVMLQRLQDDGDLLVITVGGPIRRGSHLSSYGTFADLAAATLRESGADPDRVISVPAGRSERDRIFASAVALRRWMRGCGIAPAAMNVLAAGVRARRTAIVFRRVFEPESHIGVITIVDTSYDSEHWWRSSEGFRKVIGETIAYLYVMTIGHSDEPVPPVVENGPPCPSDGSRTEPSDASHYEIVMGFDSLVAETG